MVEPDYPYILKNGHFEGQVRLEATVLPNGNVTKVEIEGRQSDAVAVCRRSGDEVEVRSRSGPDRGRGSVFNFDATVKPEVSR